MIAITRSHAYSLDGLAQVHADLDAAHRLGLDVTLVTDSSDGDPFAPLRRYRLVLTKAGAGSELTGGMAVARLTPYEAAQ